MKLTIEAKDPIEIATLAGFLAGVKPSSGSNVTVDTTSLADMPSQASPPTEIAQTTTKQGAGKRGRPKKSTELSSVTATSDASADYEPPQMTLEDVEPTTEPIVSPADAGVEYETTTEVFPTIEEVRSALIKLSDAKGVSVATGLVTEYAESRKAQDVPEDKRAELIAKAEKLKAE
jgi:hypothetical protein